MTSNSELFREERLQLIVERLVADGKVFVSELADQFGLSTSSIRNDLSELESRGLLVRTYGGAVLPEQLNRHLIVRKSALQLRTAAHQAEKDAIGRATADLIADGDTLMIDGGSTTECVVRHLHTKRGLTFVTNATSLLPILMAIPDAEIYVTGGLLHREFETLLGETSVEALGRFRAMKAILGMDGVSLHSGFTATHASVAAAKRRMASASETVIVVCDHTKFDQVCLMPIARFEEVDYLITDSGAPPHMVEAIRQQGTKVIVATVGAG
jgi:DeoR/GlpR family transcriptional regulator of sugar metabolism